MCLSFKKELNKKQLDGFKVLIKQDDGYHAIKNDLDEGVLKSNKQYTAIGDGFNVFYNRDNAEKFKEFLVEIMKDLDDTGTLNRKGQLVIMKVKGKDIFTEGRQPIARSAIFHTNTNKPINAFKCNKIKVVL